METIHPTPYLTGSMLESMLVYCRVKASVINNNRYNSRCCDNPIENWICSWKLADFFSMGDPPGESVYHGVMATENPLTTTIHGLDQAWRLPTDTPLKGCEKPCGSKREPNVWDSLSNVYIYIKHSVYVALGITLRSVPQGCGLVHCTNCKYMVLSICIHLYNRLCHDLS